MPRLEYKYLVSLRQLDRLRKYIYPYVILDKFSESIPGHKYSVRSIYYDTSGLDFYQEKLSGIKRRKKLRLRGYNQVDDQSVTFLEIKKKNGPTITKIRAGVAYSNLQKLLIEKDLDKYIINGDSARHHIQDAGQFFYYLQRFCLNPTIKVIYEREAYFCRFNPDLRITLDFNLRSSLNVNIENLYEEENLTFALPGKAILEVKLGGEIPKWLGNIISLLNLHLQALSKYTTCIDTHSKFERQLSRSIHGLARYNEFITVSKPEKKLKSC
jgi:hypothetical protein